MDQKPKQRFAKEEGEEKQLKSDFQKTSTDDETKSDSSGTKTNMPEDVKSKMENSFGTDFSDVNIHKDSDQAANFGALAYTQGSDVHFAPGQYEPGSQKGQELLGHELTHVVQQREGRVKPDTEQHKGININSVATLEKEADEAGVKAAQGKMLSKNKKNQNIQDEKFNTKTVNSDEDIPPRVINGVYFVEIPKFSMSFIVKGDMNSFTNTINGSYQSSKREFYINLQQYQNKDLTSYIGIFPTWGTVSPFVAMGQNVVNDERTGLPTDNSRSYFAKNKDGDWFAGLGNPPENAIFGFGGGIPMCINEQMYGEEDKDNILSAKGYKNQNSPEVGKVIIAHNSETNSLMLVVSPDELESKGLTLDQIRDYLMSLGYDNIMSFDGGSSATLVMDKEVLVSPAWYKDNTIPVGLKITEQ